MSLPFVFHPIAQAEFDEAAACTKGKKPGLGSDFVTEVQQILEAIATHPERYPKVFGDAREALVSRFPIASKIASSRIVSW
jgi:toxin ParE1/3/4